MAGNDDLWVGVLGPLSATRDGRPVRLPGGRAAVLMAVLALSVGQPVGVGRVAELVWPEELPGRVRPSVQTLVARARAVVPGTIVTTAGGYLLDIDPERVDLTRFRRLARAAEESAEVPAAAGLLDEALGLWRGEPLDGVASSALQREVVPGLVEERLLAVQRRAELDLAAGRPGRVVAELRALTGRYPLRESLWEQLMRALAAVGRPAEAIQHYHRIREILSVELGVDPSAELRELYQELLAGDTVLRGRFVDT